MKVKINYNNDDLWCLHTKELISIGERYVEVVEECLGEEIIKTYCFEHLNVLIDEHLDMYETEPEILGDI